jgi:hypothetical protein
MDYFLRLEFYFESFAAVFAVGDSGKSPGIVMILWFFVVLVGSIAVGAIHMISLAFSMSFRIASSLFCVR